MEGSIESMRQGDKYLLPMLQNGQGGLGSSAIDVWVGIKTHLALDSLLKKPDELSSDQILRPIFTDSVKSRLAERKNDSNFREENAASIVSALKARQDEFQELLKLEAGLGWFPLRRFPSPKLLANHVTGSLRAGQVHPRRDLETLWRVR